MEENTIGTLSVEVKIVDNKKRGATELPTLEEDEVGSVVEETEPIKIDVFAHKNEETIRYQYEDEFWAILILDESPFRQESIKEEEVAIRSGCFLYSFTGFPFFLFQNPPNWILLMLDVPAMPPLD